MIQTVSTAQELYTKASLVDYEALSAAQRESDIVAGEDLFERRIRHRREARDPRVAQVQGVAGKRLPPPGAYRKNGYQQRIEQERAVRNLSSVSTYA